MIKKLAKTILIFISILLLVPPVYSGIFRWQVLKNENFTVFYKPQHEDTAFDIIQSLEHYRPEVKKLTGNKLSNVPIVLSDIGTISNGLANPVLKNIQIFNYPPTVNPLMNSIENWPLLVAKHEYIHLMHLHYQPLQMISISSFE